MISDVFFANHLKNIPSYYYEEKYLLYKITTILYHEKCNTFIDLVHYLEKTYVSINQSKLKKFLDDNFITDHQGSKFFVSLREDQVTAMLKLQTFKSNLLVNSWQDEKILFSKISEIVSPRFFNVADYYWLIIALDKKKNDYHDHYYEALFLEMYFNYSYKRCSLDQAVEKVHEDYFDLSLKHIINNKTILELLFANEINVVADLKKVSIDSLLLIFANNTEHIISSLLPLEESFIFSYKKTIYNSISLLTQKQKDVIFKRYGFGGTEKLTLEAMGSEMDVTRERVRQIEAQGIRNLMECQQQIQDTIIALYKYLNKTSERYLEKDIFLSSIDNSYTANCALLIIQVLDGRIKYDDKLKIIYDSQETSAEELVSQVIEILGNLLSKKELGYLNSFEINVVNAYYHQYKNGIYLNKGFSIKDLIIDLIDTLFPEGYKISDDEHYKRLKNLFERKYGSFNKIPSQRSIVGFIDRVGYCQINKGTYKNATLCATIQDELKDQIFNFILINKPTVYYQSIYQTFKTKLNELGIDNYYYLKGVIDPILPSEFHTRRNYIWIGNIAVTSYEAISNYMRTFNGFFTMDDIRDKFVGIKDYTLYNVVYKEELNGLIWCSFKKFIYINKLAISMDSLNRLDSFIYELMTSLDSKVITSRKIFARLSLTNKVLLDELKVVSDQYSMFSFIKYYFKDKYYFKRPLILLEKQEKVSVENVIANYARTLESFNLRTIKKYSSKINIINLYSYLDFMDQLSDDFVQVNVDTMVKKDRFESQEEKLNEFKKMLDLMFLRTDKIDTRIFYGWEFLPQFDFKWNKNLLAGIVRTFFDSDLDIEYTDNHYYKTDYIIRRIK